MGCKCTTKSDKGELEFKEEIFENEEILNNFLDNNFTVLDYIYLTIVDAYDYGQSRPLTPKL